MSQKPAIDNEIMEELRCARKVLASDFGYDIHKLGAYLQEQQQVSGRAYISFAGEQEQITPCPATNGAKGHSHPVQDRQPGWASTSV